MSRPLSQMSISELIKAINREDDSPYYELLARAQRSTEALQEIHRVLVNLEGSEDYSRMSIAGLLGEIGEPDSIAYLVELLSYSPLVSNQAYSSLKKIGTPLAVEIAEAHIHKDAGKPEHWQALRPKLLELRRQWREEQETDRRLKQADSWIDEVLNGEEQDEDEQG